MRNRQSVHPKTLNYRLRPNTQGMRLDIWEEVPISQQNQAPYRFFITYQLASADDAQAILERYLIKNDIHSATPSNDEMTPIHLRTLASSSHG